LLACDAGAPAGLVLPTTQRPIFISITPLDENLKTQSEMPRYRGLSQRIESSILLPEIKAHRDRSRILIRDIRQPCHTSAPSSTWGY